LRDEADAKVGNPRDRRAVNDVLERLAELHGGPPALALLPITWERPPKTPA